MAIALDNLDTRLPICLKNTLGLLWEQYKLTAEQLTEAEKYKAHLVYQLEPWQRPMDLEHIGRACTSMLYANIGDGREFKNRRQAPV